MVDISQRIPEFFSDKCVFITGATGFMGKALVEKLLRSCPGIKRIYVLIRSKKGKNVSQRLQDLLHSKVFDKLREEKPEFTTKVTAVEGDIMHDNLGISRQDEDVILNSVTVVFHVAATVKFDEKMGLSVAMNVLGVKHVIHFCKKAKHLQAFLHVSTAYANCTNVTVEEKIYDPPIQPKRILDAVDWMEEDILELLTPKMVGNRPNTYTYTKAVAEYLIREECRDIPTAIFRPSIVGASHSEPFPGWVDNYNGPTGIIAATAAGVLKVMKGDKDATADIIPVDIATRMMIAVAWYTALHRFKDVQVYHCTTGLSNKLTWGHVVSTVKKYAHKHPMNSIARVPHLVFTRHVSIHNTILIFDQIVPSYVMDFCLRCMGQKPRFMRTQEKLGRAVACLEYFTTQQWTFKNDNFHRVLKALLPADRKEFCFDPQIIHWSKYFELYCLGIKQFLLNEELNGIPNARRTLTKLQVRSFLVNTVVIVVIWRMLANRARLSIALWNHLMNLTVKMMRFIQDSFKIS